MSVILHQNLFPAAIILRPQECEGVKFTARALNPVIYPNDANAFKAIRLEALSGDDSRYFGASYEEESQFTDDQWAKRTTPTEKHSVFGLFVRNYAGEWPLQETMIATMAATHWDGADWDGDKNTLTAKWGSAYTKPAYRNHSYHGEKVTALLYKARIEWTQKKGFSRAVFFIREGNEKSTAIHQKQGAEPIHKEPMRWANGDIADAFWFEKRLGLNLSHLSHC